MTTATRSSLRARRPSWLRLVAGQVRYQAVILLRSPGGPFFAVVVPLMVLAALNFLQGDEILRSRGGIRFPQFFTPAMAAFAVMNACYVTTVTGTVIARDEGILKRLRGTPLPPLAYMAGRIGAASLVAAVAAFLVIVVGHFGYGAEVMLRTLPALVVTVAVGMVCFALVGLAVTIVVPTTEVALPVAYGTLLPLCFVSDVFFPADAAPGWLSNAASAFPVKHLAVALERTLNPTVAGAGWDGWNLGILAAWTVAALAVTLVFFRWDRRAGGEHRRHRVPAFLGRRAS